MNNDVAVLRCTEYDAELLLEKLREAYELAGGSDVLDLKGKRVLLKPNILMDHAPEKAVTTHPEFLRAAIRLVKERGASEIFVGDSPGFQKPGFKGRKCRLGAVTEAEGAVWYDFSSRTTIINCPGGRMINQFQVSDIVSKVDIIISLPKMKTHQLMFFTGAIKNQFGLIPGLSKSPFHMMFPGRTGFAEMIVDLHQAVKPDFAFMDGITAMEGPGPGNGFPKQANLILASSNLLALDITACRIIGYDPDVVPINKAALERGLWLDSSKDINIRGLPLDDAKMHHFQKIKLTGTNSQLLEFLTPHFFKKIEARLAPRPVFRESKCIRCGECVKICPAEALRIDGMVKIDYEKCIRCFCCHEVCPEDAIAVKSAPFTSGVIS